MVSADIQPGSSDILAVRRRGLLKTLHDHQGLAIRLTDERLAHILEHPEMVGMESAIEETLQGPDRIKKGVTLWQAKN